MPALLVQTMFFTNGFARRRGYELPTPFCIAGAVFIFSPVKGGFTA
jgi:hypothetical protein